MNDDEFDKYEELLRISYSENPNNTMKELKKILQKLSMIPIDENVSMKTTFLRSIKEIEFFPFAVFLGIIFTSLIGLFQINNYGMYIFGEVFFFAGFGIGLYAPFFGLIFLASHGGTGYAMMLGVLLADSFNSPIWSDNPSSFYLYFGLMAIILIIAVLLSIVHNISSAMKRDKRFAIIIL